MKYVSVSEARGMSGLRLALSAGVPGPWGEAAKGIFHTHDVPYVPVAQYPLEENAELVEWTGIRNAPVAVYDAEKPVSNWLDILMLAERLGAGPSLLPSKPKARESCIGIIRELAGEWGFGWCRRLQILHALWVDRRRVDLYEVPASLAPFQRQYGVYPDQIYAAPKRIAAILDALAARLTRQTARQSAYLVGNDLSAADVYWACFSAMLAPMPHKSNPMPAELRQLYEDTAPTLPAAVREPLLEHRNRIYKEHLQIPVDF